MKKGRKVNRKKVSQVIGSTFQPRFINFATDGESTRTRRNRSSTIERTDRFVNIDEALVPFKRVKGGSNVTISEAIDLCQKAYYNFSIFRNTIDVMTEFSSSNIYFRGGTKKGRDFFMALCKKLNLWSVQDRFFREFYRSGNVWIYRIEGSLGQEDLKNITQVYGAEANSAKVKIPLRYVILNPTDIQLGGSASFYSSEYYKELSDYELQCLRSGKTEEDKEIMKALPPEVRKAIYSKNNETVLLPLTPQNVSAVFYKKQDYEPFAVPMGYPVLEDINWKAEMKKMDMSITRTFQQVILLVTAGAPEKDGGINYKNLEVLQELFANESIGRVLVADYTTEAKFIVPEIANLLDPKKYELIDKDIKMGLNYILMGDNEKFANQSIKVKVFVERLKQAREAFINDFLLPEVKRISKEMGFKSYPTPFFEDINLKDDAEWQRISTRLMEIGMLTPSEGFEAIETGKLPVQEDSVESQRAFKKLRDEGLYQPLTGGPADQMELTKESGQQQLEIQTKKLSMETGRPPGSKAPQTTKKVKPVGASEASESFDTTYSILKVKGVLDASRSLEKRVNSLLKKRFGKPLNDDQLRVAEEIAHVIMANEAPKEWHAKAKEYVESPVDKNPERINEIREIAYAHQCNDYLATILYHSKQ